MGQINDGQMLFSGFGKIVNEEWLKSFEIRDELYLDEYIIMPNHLHAIVVLNNHRIEKNGTPGMYDSVGTDETHVETHGRASLQSPQQSDNPSRAQSPIFRKPQSISSFIGGFKSAVNSKIDNFIDNNHLNIPKYNQNNHFFQPNYHDHIIRNHLEYQHIKKYIINNPAKWNDDTFNPINPKTEL
ncbi:MAG: hypothetical protein K9J27_10690 [Bacteroidales bacterium]|nr:hypothetical protein [Bacteroidales bacterium]MCF8334307.1 hypothetical protein [Bacteroidales bacterium]